MGNEGNLKPMGKGNRSKEEERAIQSKGGKNSGVTRRRKRDMKQAAKLLMGLDVTNGKLADQIKSFGIDDDEITNQMAVMVSMLIQATKGNVKAAEFIRDTMGESPEVNYKMAELAQRKKEFEYQKQKDQEQSGQSGNDALRVWAEKVKQMREDSGDG